MVISVALEGYGPITVACARTTLAALSLLGLMAVRRTPLPSRETARYIVSSGLLSTAIPFIALSWGLQYVPSSFAGISMACVPLFVLPIAHFFSDERLTTRRGIGVVIGFAGALVLIGPDALSFGSLTVTLGQLACLFAALCYAISSVQIRNCPPVDPLSIGAFSLLVGSVVLIPLMLIFEGIPGWQGVRPGLAIVILGFLPTAFATALRILIIRSAGAVFMTLVNYQVPLWSLAYGVLLLGESAPPSLILALVLIFAGLFTSQFGALKRLFFRP
jgi:drug/metabolite transporter (DMT)-like permease